MMPYTIWNDSFEVDHCVSKFGYMNIDLKANNGEGFQYSPELLFVDSFMTFRGFTGVRYANGRDWWFWRPSFKTGQYHKILVDPLGVHYKGIFQTDSAFLYDPQSGGAYRVSPDGQRLYASNTSRQRHQINVWLIDRCTGDLTYEKSYIRPLPPQPENLGSLLPYFHMRDFFISPNSRYIYYADFEQPILTDTNELLYNFNADTYARVWQIDIETASIWDPQTSLVGVDTLNKNIPEYYGTYFWQGRDFQIYQSIINKTNSQTPTEFKVGLHWCTPTARVARQAICLAHGATARSFTTDPTSTLAHTTGRPAIPSA